MGGDGDNRHGETSPGGLRAERRRGSECGGKEGSVPFTQRTGVGATLASCSPPHGAILR